MSLRTFIVVALLAVLSVIFAFTSRPVWHAPEKVGNKLFPGLGERINDISSFTIYSAPDSITVTRSPQGWHLEKWDGYPADVSKIRAMVAEMLQAVLLEPKTADVGRHALLDLVSPSEEAEDGKPTAAFEGRGRELTLKDANGNVLTELIIGRRRLGVAGSAGVYVRRPGETQTWLASTSLFPTTDLSGWGEPIVLGVESTRLAQVILRHSNGQTIIVKQHEKRTPITVQPLPFNATVDKRATHRMVALLLNLTFEDVRAAARHGGDSEAAQTEITTYDGLKITIATYKRAGTTWLSLKEARAATASAEVQKEADALQRKYNPWVYKIPPHIAAAFHPLPEDLSQLQEGQEGEEPA